MSKEGIALSWEMWDITPFRSHRIGTKPKWSVDTDIATDLGSEPVTIPTISHWLLVVQIGFRFGLQSHESEGLCFRLGCLVDLFLLILYAIVKWSSTSRPVHLNSSSIHHIHTPYPGFFGPRTQRFIDIHTILTPSFWLLHLSPWQS